MSSRPTSTLELPSPRLLSSKPSSFFRRQYEIYSLHKRAVSSVREVTLPAIEQQSKAGASKIPEILSTDPFSSAYGTHCCPQSALPPSRNSGLCPRTHAYSGCHGLAGGGSCQMWACGPRWACSCASSAWWSCRSLRASLWTWASPLTTPTISMPSSRCACHSCSFITCLSTSGRQSWQEHPAGSNYLNVAAPTCQTKHLHST